LVPTGRSRYALYGHLPPHAGLDGTIRNDWAGKPSAWEWEEKSPPQPLLPLGTEEEEGAGGGTGGLECRKVAVFESALLEQRERALESQRHHGHIVL
jgi:hypothetical protein